MRAILGDYNDRVWAVHGMHLDEQIHYELYETRSTKTKETP